MDRKVYLNLISPEYARKQWFEKIKKECQEPGMEKVGLADSAGRVVATPILAERSSPAFHGAAMDGYAVLAEDTFGASSKKPLALELGKKIWPVNTGQPLPENANAVIMVEDVNLDEPGNQVILEKAAFPWQHVRKTGEDIVETEVILAPGTVIGASEIGALAAGGVLHPEVFKKAKVLLIPSGSDLVPLLEADDHKLGKGEQLPEFNSLVFTTMLKAIGADAEILPIVEDNPGHIFESLTLAEKKGADLILLNAGTSAGSRDFSAKVIEESGELIVHGIKMMPGKPTVLGIANLNGRKIPIAGIPGYPVSAYMAMEQFVLPLLAHWQKRGLPEKSVITAYPINHLASRPGMEEKVRVKLGVVDGKTWAVPLPRGAGTVTSLSRADGIISIASAKEGINAEEPVETQLLRSPGQISDSLLAIGSHDNSLDLIDSLLRKRHPRFRLTSAHVGSLGGLVALAKGQAHLAGTHLLDPETGIYNQNAIKENLGDMKIALIRLADREQGLIVAKGNPHNIRELKDIAKKQILFINRQRGSGTRVLLDYNLAKLNISAWDVKGYKDEEYTHMNVAQAVLAGRADAGLGVRAAANALGLDFIPVGHEEYDLAIPVKYLEDERIIALIDVIKSDEFKKRLLKMGGYGVERTGDIVWKSDDAI